MTAKLESDTDAFRELELSTSTTRAKEALSAIDAVPAWAIVEQLLMLHPEYADGKAKEFKPPPDVLSSREMPVANWLTNLNTVLIRETVQTLHGRSVILGLSLLDPELGRALRANDFLDTLASEIKEPFERILTSEGMDRWNRIRGLVDDTPDAVPTHADNPARVDLLGREAFASALAIRLRTIRQENDLAASKAGGVDQPGAFLLHIHGPWRSGKTSLLNFVRDELRKPLEEGRIQRVDSSPWIVVDFNAWQHQRVDPPWWPLLPEYLERHPQKASEIGSKDPMGVEDPGLRRLFSDETVQYVFEGRGSAHRLMRPQSARSPTCGLRKAT